MAIKIFKGWNKDGDTFKVQDERADNLGTASTKNSTSVVTESTDLVESGAVKDIVGWGNKNLLNDDDYVSNVIINTSNGIVESASDAGVFYAYLKPNTTYTLSFNNGDRLAVASLNRIPVIGDSVKRIIYGASFANVLTFTTENDESLIGFYVNRYESSKPTQIQVEKGSTATAYEPYHASVEESFDEKADTSVIAPTENGTTASQAYAVGEHFIRDGAFCTCKQAISQGGSFTLGTNYTAGDVADNIEDLYSHIGYLSTPVPAYVARQAPKRFKDITNDWFSGTLRTEIASGDFKNIIPGDYVIDPTTGSKFYVANLDGRIGLGDNTNNTNYPAYGTHHVNFMLEKAGSGATRMWSGYGYSDKSWRVSANDKNRCPWNAETSVDPTDSEAIGSNSTNITRSYGGSNMSAYMGSFIRQRIDEVLLPLFQSVFGSSNILKYREWNSNGIDTTAVSPAQTSWTGIANNCAWVDRYLDLPSEIELYGARIASSSYKDVGCQCEKLPLFDGAMLHNIFPRMDVWTKAVASSSSACARAYGGYAYAYNASYAVWACPLACVK